MFMDQGADWFNYLNLRQSPRGEVLTELSSKGIAVSRSGELLVTGRF